MIKVLIVDDEYWNRDIIKTFGEFERHGMAIVGEADDGMEAVRMIEENRPQLVVTDMRMPGADGVELMAILNDRYPEIKVIVVSGYDDFDYTKYAIRYKAVDYLLKPIDPKELNAALAKCKSELEAAAEDRIPAPEELDLSFSLSAHKQMLRARFQDPNPEGVRSVFAQIAEDLEHGGMNDSRRLASVIHEMLLFLKELMNDHALDSDVLKEVSYREALGSPGEAAAYLTRQFLNALEELIERRKFRNKLNLAEIAHYIERHYAEPISLESVAKAFFVSKEYLSKVFKQAYSRNVTDYILHLRMEKARELLSDASIPIKAVAEMTGYEDIGYFYRVFKKHFGIAPGEMRKQYGQQV